MTRTGNFKEALTTLERGLQIANDMFRSTPAHPLIAQCKLYLGLLLIEPSSCQDLIQAEIYLKEALVMQSNVYSECERELISNSSLSLEIINTIKTDWLLVYFNLQVSNFGNRKVLPSKTGSMIQSIKIGLSSLI